MARRKEEAKLYPNNLIKDAFSNKKIDIEHFDANFEKAKKTILNTKEVFVIESYYKEGKSLEEIGMTFGVGKERCRQFKHCGVLKLKKYSKMFTSYVETDNEGFTSISELNLNIKSYNALVNNNILSIEELKKISYDDLCKIPSVGDRIRNDIISALKEYENGPAYDIPCAKYVYKDVKNLLDKYNITYQNLLDIMNHYEH